MGGCTYTIFAILFPIIGMRFQLIREFYSGQAALTGGIKVPCKTADWASRHWNDSFEWFWGCALTCFILGAYQIVGAVQNLYWNAEPCTKTDEQALEKKNNPKENIPDKNLPAANASKPAPKDAKGPVAGSTAAKTPAPVEPKAGATAAAKGATPAAPAKPGAPAPPKTAGAPTAPAKPVAAAGGEKK